MYCRDFCFISFQFIINFIGRSKKLYTKTSKNRSPNRMLLIPNIFTTFDLISILLYFSYIYIMFHVKHCISYIVNLKHVIIISIPTYRKKVYVQLYL